MSNERRLEDGIEHGEDGMVQDTILHGRFVDASLLGIADGEGAIRLMPVGSGDQLSVQLKEVLLQIPLELLHVLPSLFSFAELLPCDEEIFLGGDPLEEVSVYLHCCILPAPIGRFCCVAALTETAFGYKLHQGVLSEHRQGFGSETSTLRPYKQGIGCLSHFRAITDKPEPTVSSVILCATFEVVKESP